MNITAVQNYNLYSKQCNPNFKANNRKIIDKATGNVYKTTTYFFREDLNWDGFVKLLDNKYKDTLKVNVYNDACSGGHEPVSLAIKLKQRMGKRADKFFPIHASDYNPTNIKNAKAGIMGIKNEELYRINEETNNRYRDYFSFAPRTNFCDDLALSPKGDLSKNIEYKQGDIFKNIEQMPSSNTVLLCRNFWRYLPEDGNNAEKLAQKLGEKLDSSSLVVIGEHDGECNTKGLLEKYGFEETPVQYVFQKRGK